MATLQGGRLLGVHCTALIQAGLTDLFALVADIVSILPHGVVQWLLVELGGGRGDGLTLHQVLVL